MKTNTLFLCLLFIVIPVIISAQSFTLTGKVLDSSNRPFPGVNVVIKGTTTGTVTDINGDFSIQIQNPTAVLVFSFVGCLTEEIEVNLSNPKISVMLKDDTVSLEEIVVVGYGVVKKSVCTGAISEIKGLPGRVAGVEATPGKTGPISNSYKSGLLTAGELNDFGKWRLWKDISEKELNQFKNLWYIKPQYRYTVQLKTNDKMPVIDAEVSLLDEEGKIFWRSKTDNTGKTELWYGAFNYSLPPKKLYGKVSYLNKEYSIGRLKEFHKGINKYTIKDSFTYSKLVDIAFVVDATGSMGDEIDYLKAELKNIIENVKDTVKGATVNLGTVFYRDKGDEYITKLSDFSSNINTSVDFIKSNRAGGGGDFPEAVDEALNVAIENMSWHQNAQCRILFLLLDAPPHDSLDQKTRLQNIVRRAAVKGIRIVPITCSGIDKSTEYLMRSLALLTNGSYVFLTDDSGIGDSHIKPTTDEYTVELLSDLLIRLIYQFTQVPERIANPKEIEVDTCIVISNDELKSVDEESEEPQKITWKYYPNPTCNIINIESDVEINQIFITDLSGKILEKHFVGAMEFTINLAGYPMGIYYISYEYAPDKWLKGKVLLIE